MFKKNQCVFQSIAEKAENECNLASLENSDQLLDYLNRTYHTSKNVYFLKGLFLASQAPELYEICLRYAKTRENKIIFFEKHLLENGKDIY